MEKQTLLLELDCHDRDYCMVGDSFTEPEWSFTTKPTNGKIRALNNATYCRESVCEFIRQQVRGVANYHINLNRLHMYIYRRVAAKTGPATFQRQVEAGLNIVNAIEGHYGWPLTKIYPAELPDEKAAIRNRYFYINASKRWMKAPAMLSMFLLFFRLAALSSKNFDALNSITTFNSVFKVLDKLAHKSRSLDFAFYEEHGKQWRIVLDNYKKLFATRNIRNLYVPGNGSYFFSEGINRLCDLDSNDAVLLKAFKGLCK